MTAKTFENALRKNPTIRYKGIQKSKGTFLSSGKPVFDKKISKNIVLRNLSKEMQELEEEKKRFDTGEHGRAVQEIIDLRKNYDTLAKAGLPVAKFRGKIIDTSKPEGRQMTTIWERCRPATPVDLLAHTNEITDIARAADKAGIYLQLTPDSFGIGQNNKVKIVKFKKIMTATSDLDKVIMKDLNISNVSQIYKKLRNIHIK